MPFYYVQIAPWKSEGNDKQDWAWFRQCQLELMSEVPNVGMVTTGDAGSENFIHSPYKIKIGERLAYWALAKTYHRKGIQYSGPIYKSHRIKENIEEIYVTIFDKRDEQKRLISLLEQWGFAHWGMKGEEQIYLRDFTPSFNISQLKQTYPYISKSQDAYIVPIYPDYHTELFPDSILNIESPEEFIEDFPHRNCIGKVYVSRAIPPHPQIGDILIFYRTGGFYKSVVTTIGIVQELCYNFNNEEEFILYCRKSSVYPEDKLREMWRYSPNKPFTIRFLYSYSFPHRVNMKELIDLGILAGINDAPRGFKHITKEQFDAILKTTKSDESFIIN